MKRKRQSQELLFGITVFFYCITAAFRGDTVGGDLYAYFSHFEYVQSVPSLFNLRSLISSGFEPGYTLFVKLLTLVSQNRRFFLFITAILSLVGPISFAKRYSPWPFFSLLLYLMLGFYTNTFNNIRQSLAISIVFMGFPFIFSRRFTPYLLVIIAAATLHVSAMAAILLYWAPRIRLNKRNILVYYGVGLSAFYVAGAPLLGFVRNNVLTKFAGDGGDLWGTGEGYGLLVLMVVICCIAVFSLHEKKREVPPERQVILNFLVASIFLASIFQLFATLMATMTRLTFYFYIPVIALIPNCLYLVKDWMRRAFLVLGIYMVCFIYMGMMTFARVPGTGSNSQGVIPYSITITNNEY